LKEQRGLSENFVKLLVLLKHKGVMVSIVMRFAIGFFGFARKIPKSCDIDKFLSLFPEGSVVDIFISVPTVVDEYLNINTLVDQKTLTGIFGDRLKVADFFEYDPHKHIRKARTLGLADFNATHNYHPYRQLSLIYSISNISKIINDYNGDYDNIILTRFDIFQTITSFGKLLEDKNTDTIYGFRDGSPTCFEDRIIISCKDGIERMAAMYDTFAPSSRDETKHIIEFFLAQYVNEQINLKKGILKDLNIGLNSEWTHGGNGKYSEGFKNYINSILIEYS
jgi:hypothetical protein